MQFHYETLEEMSLEDRLKILDMIYFANSGHIGSSFSCVEILNASYHFLDINKDNVHESIRNKFILSKGHAAPALYSVLMSRNIIDKSHLYSLRKYKSILQGHPDMNKTPGVDMSSGSLGNGISAGVGMAWFQKTMNTHKKTIVLLGDGEIQEGIVWEAIMSSVHLKLDNLILIIDKNNLQINGETHDIMSIYNLVDVLKSFGLNVYSVDGHNIKKILDILDVACSNKNSPSVIIANTVKGKGISFMENEHIWHSKVPNEDEYILAKYELERSKKIETYSHNPR